VRAAAESESQHVVLSKRGCGRATGYAEANKIVTVDAKTHVAWLDSVAEGFRVRVRTLDRATGVWSPTYTVGRAADNHGGPALTVDSKGFLHVAYYPHHHPMRYRRSIRPNDASEWTEEVRVGKRCTYPTLVCDRDDTLYLTCRESAADALWVANLYVKRPDAPWQGPRALLQAESRGYAHFMEALAWGSRGDTLHLACRIYDGQPRRGHTIGYLRTKNRGVTWTHWDGSPVALPATAQTVDIVSQKREGPGVGLRAGALAVGPDDKPYVLCSSYDESPMEAWLAYPDDTGAWNQRPLRPELPDGFADWGLATPGGITFSEDGRLFVVLTLIKPPDLVDSTVWGHASSEIAAFISSDNLSLIHISEPTRPY